MSRTQTVLEALGISRGPGALAALRALPAETFLSIAADINLGVPFPTVDGVHLPESPLVALAGGASRTVPVIIGTNSHESGSLRLIVHAPEEPFTFDERVRGIVAPEGVDALLELYSDGDDHARWDTLSTDRDWHTPVRDLALAHSNAGGTSYVYEFGWLTDALDGALGSAHMAEIPFFLDNLAGAATSGMFRPTIAEEDAAVNQSRIMSAAWADFIETGDPGAPDGVEWQPFTVDQEFTLVFDDGTATLTTQFRAREIAYWRAHAVGGSDE